MFTSLAKAELKVVLLDGLISKGVIRLPASAGTLLLHEPQVALILICSEGD